MIILVGVTHILDLREKVRGLIVRERPAVVCVELDDSRLDHFSKRADGSFGDPASGPDGDLDGDPVDDPVGGPDIDPGHGTDVDPDIVMDPGIELGPGVEIDPVVDFDPLSELDSLVMEDGGRDGGGRDDGGRDDGGPEVDGPKVTGGDMIDMAVSLEETFARLFRTDPGSEMVGAILASRELGVPVLPIDVEMTEQFDRIQAAMAEGEAEGFMEEGRELEGLSREDLAQRLREYLEEGDAFLERSLAGYPALRRYLVDERDKHLADRILTISAGSSPTLAVLGDGHLRGVLKRLRRAIDDTGIRVIRLVELLTPREWNELLGEWDVD